MTHVLGGFQRHDAGEAEALFRFLDAVDRLDFIQSIKHTMLARAPVSSGQRVLDVGCGLCHELARFVDLGADAVGIDHNALAIAEAQRRWPSIAVSVGDAHTLSFADGSFDLVRSERVFEYLADPSRALAEMVRVARVGGQVVVFDFDYDGMVVSHPDRALLRRIKQVVFESVPHGGIATELAASFQHAGLVDIHVVPVLASPPLMVFERVVGPAVARGVEAGLLGADEVAGWWAGLRALGAGFVSGMTGFVVSGRKA